MTHPLSTLCVFAGSSAGQGNAYRAAAADLGRILVERRIDLVYGGANVGLMGILADTVLAGGGCVTGVIPEALVAREVAHRGLTELRVVKSMHERKALMSERADAFIALPGGWGTVEEFFEVLTWAQLGLHAKPCGLLNVEGYFDPLLAFVTHSMEQGFVKPEYRSMIVAARSPSDLLGQLADWRVPPVRKWIDRGDT